MNDKTNIASTADSSINGNAKPKPGVISIVVAVVMILINGMFGYLLGDAKSAGNDAYSAGYAMGYVFSAAVLCQGIVITLFQIGKRFRNTKSMVKIYCWTSLVVLLGLFAQFGALMSKE